MPSRRAALLRSGVIVLVLFVVFGLILPQFVDYEEVLTALAGLTIQQFAVMTVLGIIAWFVCGQLFTLLIPGMTPLKGMTAYLILSGIGSSIPFGPWNMGVVWVVFRGWGISGTSATSGSPSTGSSTRSAASRCRVAAFLILLITGEVGDWGRGRGPHHDRQRGDLRRRVRRHAGRRPVRPDCELGREPHRADRLLDPDAPATERAPGCHRLDPPVPRLARRRRSPAGTGRDRADARRPDPVVDRVRRRAAVHGRPRGRARPPARSSRCSRSSRVITIIPIAPGGAGVPELLYIAGLSALAGAEWEAAITAGVFLFRLYVWFLPIPLAWILLKIARRGRPMLPTAGELRSYAASSS